MSSTSGELIQGTYQLSAPDEGMERWRLDLAFVSDNNATDCEGDMIDESGRAHTFFVELSEDGDRIDMFVGAEDVSPLESWTRG